MVPDSKNPENYNVFQNLWNNPIKFGIPIDSVTVLFIEQKILKNPMNKKFKSKHIAVYIFSFVVSQIHQISCGMDKTVSPVQISNNALEHKQTDRR